jgi:hypothetical protein
MSAGWGFTPAFWSQGQRVLDLLPHSTHELPVLLVALDRSGLRASFPAWPICCSAFQLWSASLAVPTAGPTTPSADFCLAVRRSLGRLSRFVDDTKQISRGKLNRLRCTTAGSTLRAVDGYGLRDTLPARPALTPRIRFLSIGSHLCSTLPSDPASRRQPLRFTNPSPPSGWVEDFHLRAIEHARHTTNPLAREGHALPRVRCWRGGER